MTFTSLSNEGQGEKGSNVASGQPAATFQLRQDLVHDHTSPEGLRTRPQVQRVAHIMLRPQAEATRYNTDFKPDFFVLNYLGLHKDE